MVGVQKLKTMMLLFLLFSDHEPVKFNSLLAISRASKFSIYKMNLGPWICKDHFHLINILLSIFSTSFIEFFENAANPQQFKQLSAQNRSNFPKIQPDRLCTWIKDHRLDSPWRCTSQLGKGETHLSFLKHLTPSKQPRQLASLPSYFPSIFLPSRGAWGPDHSCLIPWELNLSWGWPETPVVHTRQKCLHESIIGLVGPLSKFLHPHLLVALLRQFEVEMGLLPDPTKGWNHWALE